MGKGGGSQQQEVNEYRMSLHYGVCVGPSVLRKIEIDDKVVWQGRMADAGPIYINLPTLFGGPKKEGGVAGTIYWLPGKEDQVLPDGLARRLGLTSATCPAFRGKSTLFFTGALNGGGGFLWSSNTPFIRPVKVTVERAPVGLNPLTALMISNFSARFAGRGLTVTTGNTTLTLTDGVAARVGDQTIKGTISSVDGTRTINVNGGDVVQQFFIYSPALDRNIPGFTVTVNGDTVTFPTSGGTATVDGATVVVQSDGSLIYTRSGADSRNANPAHMIYECLTNTDWGMAAPEYLIDKANYEAVAQKLYDERFPLSILWTQQDTVEKYVSEILDHILATVFVNPRTGLLSILLLRDDYDFSQLRQINPSNAKLRNFKRKLYGETINEVVVSWTNPETEKQQTVTAQDLANIEIQGSPVSDSRNYYGIRSAELASRIASRDSASASAPLATLEMELERGAWDLLPGEVVRVNWPRYRLNDVVCRVMKVAYGKAGDPAITVTLMEDIFSISKPAQIAPPVTAWQGVSEPPAPMQFASMFTLPYYLAAKETTSEPAYPEVIAGMLAYQPGGATLSYDLFTRQLQANGSMAWQSVGTKTLTGRAAMATPLYAEATSVVAGLPLSGEERGPQVNGLVVIGEGDATMEIGLLSAFDGENWTVRRGVLDTIPRVWPVGTPVWFIPPTSTIGDTFELRAPGEQPEYKLLTRTSKGTLAIDDAPVVTGTITARPHAPLRPANVRINGAGFGDIDAAGATALRVQWATRNRLTEDTIVMPWDSGAVTPEYLQMTIVTVFRENGAPMITWRGLYTENELNIPIEYVQQEKAVFVRVTSERSGIGSVQGHGLWVRNIPQVASPAPPPTPVEPPAPPPPTPDPEPTPDPIPGPDNDARFASRGYAAQWY